MALERVPSQIRARAAWPDGLAEEDSRDHARRFRFRSWRSAGSARRRSAGSPAAWRGLHRRVRVLTPADEAHHIEKHAFTVPFVCARAIWAKRCAAWPKRRVDSHQGGGGTGDVVHAVKHLRLVLREIKLLTVLGEEELSAKAKELGAPYELGATRGAHRQDSVPNFCAGGIAHARRRGTRHATRRRGGVLGSGNLHGERHRIRAAGRAERRARAIVLATTHSPITKRLLEACEDLPAAMKGLASPRSARISCSRRAGGEPPMSRPEDSSASSTGR